MAYALDMMRNADQLLTRAQRARKRVFPSTNRRVDSSAGRGEQLVLSQQYRTAAAAGLPLPSFADAEFRNYSQNGEDGILLLIATVLGLSRRRVVEIGASDGIECNAANLILHHGWEGLLIDGDADLIERGRRFYATQSETSRLGPNLVCAWITRDNVKALLAEHGYARDVDLLSVDVDGMDLWVLKALEPSASVLIVEFNNRLPDDVAVTVPYREDFVGNGNLTHGEGHFGASLLAFVRMLRPFGYRLVGANSISTNAFFVRDGVGDEILPEVSAAACQSARWARTMTAKWWPSLQAREWVEIP